MAEHREQCYRIAVGPAMTLCRQVTLSDEVLFRELDGEAVLLDLESQTYFGLDELGTRIWQLLVEHRNTEPVVTTLLAEYEVDRESLERDVEAFVERLRSQGLLIVE